MRDCGLASRLVVLAEPEIAPGDCRIEWADGGIRRESAATEQAIEEAVARYLDARIDNTTNARRSLEVTDERRSQAGAARPRKRRSAAADGPGPFGNASDAESTTRGAADLEAVFDVPVKVSAVLGRARMEVGELLKLGPGAVLELDRKVGEAIDIYVNDRLVARGEVVLVEDKLGVTMTEIIKAERN